MRFSTFIFPLTILAGLVLASPLEERGTKVTEVASASEPKYGPVSSNRTQSSEGVHVEGGKGVTVAKPGKSKRSDYNQLDGRSTPYGVLVVCTGYGCGGDCYGYSLPVNPYICYGSTGTIRSTFRLPGPHIWCICGQRLRGVLRSYPFSERLI